MIRNLRDGEHTIGFVEGGTPLPPEQQTLDIGPTAVVHIHQPLNAIFVWGRAVVHVHAEVKEIWVWAQAEVHVHAVCPKVYSSEEAVIHCDAPGTLVIATHYTIVHAVNGVRVIGYNEAEIWAPSGLDVTISGYAKWHTDDGKVHGNMDTYRPGYCIAYRRRYGSER
jgi:hypothetical protein